MKTYSVALLLTVFASYGAANEPVTMKKDDGGTFLQRLFSKHGPKTEKVPETWTLYAAKERPAGRTVDAADLQLLDVKSYDSENVYVSGTFVVTASGTYEAILRVPEALFRIRVIAKYPTSDVVPAEGKTLKVENTLGLRVKEVRRDDTGGLNIYVRDIAKR